jgi:hypothetical protein
MPVHHRSPSAASLGHVAARDIGAFEYGAPNPVEGIFAGGFGKQLSLL